MLATIVQLRKRDAGIIELDVKAEKVPVVDDAPPRDGI
jgi:hypothetical protein